MKVANFLGALALLALASSFATAYDPSPLQDICVAINDTDSAVLVNGKFCKNPSLYTPDDFSFSGFDVPGNTSNQLGVHVNIVTADLMPGLNTLGVSMARIDFAPNGGLNPPHYHPRASEVLLVLKGTLYAGFVTSNPDHRLFTEILKTRRYFLNIVADAISFAALTSQEPGVINPVSKCSFLEPVGLIYPEVLATALQMDKRFAEDLQLKTGVNPSPWTFECKPCSEHVKCNRVRAARQPTGGYTSNTNLPCSKLKDRSAKSTRQKKQLLQYALEHGSVMDLTGRKRRILTVILFFVFKSQISRNELLLGYTTV
ncbi:germin-like protein subfamily 1 member 16 [Populus alba]|nr:germin-like protein subfamily 1 member 16 [Populus alba]